MQAPSQYPRPLGHTRLLAPCPQEQGGLPPGVRAWSSSPRCARCACRCLPPAYLATDAFHPDEGGITLHDPARGGQFARPLRSPREAPASCQRSTTFHAFARMLLDRGASPGGGVLSEASVDLMTSVLFAIYDWHVRIR